MKARFLREAQTLVHLENRHIVSVFDFGPLGEDHFFMVMEYIDGESLRDLSKVFVKDGKPDGDLFRDLRWPRQPGRYPRSKERRPYTDPHFGALLPVAARQLMRNANVNYYAN